MIKSYNKQIICEPYRGSTGIKSKISSGVAVIQQKVGVIGLKVLQDAVIDTETTLKAGDIVYIREEILHTNKPYSQALECKDIKVPFALINFAHVAFVKGK